MRQPFSNGRHAQTCTREHPYTWQKLTTVERGPWRTCGTHSPQRSPRFAFGRRLNRGTKRDRRWPAPVAQPRAVFLVSPAPIAKLLPNSTLVNRRSGRSAYSPGGKNRTAAFAARQKSGSGWIRRLRNTPVVATVHRCLQSKTGDRRGSKSQSRDRHESRFRGEGSSRSGNRGNDSRNPLCGEWKILSMGS